MVKITYSGDGRTHYEVARELVGLAMEGTLSGEDMTLPALQALGQEHINFVVNVAGYAAGLATIVALHGAQALLAGHVDEIEDRSVEDAATYELARVLVQTALASSASSEPESNDSS